MPRLLRPDPAPCFIYGMLRSPAYRVENGRIPCQITSTAIPARDSRRSTQAASSGGANAGQLKPLADGAKRRPT